MSEEHRAESSQIVRSASTTSISSVLLHPFTLNRQSTTRYSVSSYQQRDDNLDAQTIPAARKPSILDMRGAQRNPQSGSPTKAQYDSGGNERSDETSAINSQVDTESSHIDSSSSKGGNQAPEDGSDAEADVTLESYRNEMRDSQTEEQMESELPNAPQNRWFGWWGKQPDTVAEPEPEDLEPNLLSRVVTSSGQLAPVVVDMPKKSWWWGWSSGEPERTHSEATIDELQETTAEAEASMAARTASYGKACSWAYWRSFEDQMGLLSIVGSKSFKEPYEIANPIVSNYAKQESMESEPDGADESVVIPRFDWNYREMGRRTKLRLMALRGPLARFIPGETHLYRTEERPNAEEAVRKKALVVGIHSFLPHKLVQTFVAESTGTADELVTQGVLGMQRWGEEHGVEVDVDTMALDGYGKIFDRVNHCISLMEGYDLAHYNFVVVVSNYQAVAISIHVLARLINAGYLARVDRVGMINIQGPCLGPVVGLDSKLSVKQNSGLENEILLELFDFQDPQTLQSKELARQLQILIEHNVKATFIGSLTDTLTPLYSSLCVHLSHPNVYRGVYIDGGMEQPDFLVTLMSLVLAVKNLGLNDHELLVELSGFFTEYANATKKIMDPKHRPNSWRKAYRNYEVYKLGLANSLSTSDLFTKQEMQEEGCDVRQWNSNEYHLPWCMRGFMEELSQLKKKDRQRDTGQTVYQLLEEFRSWQPSQPDYKELRYCIEALERMDRSELGL